jgi:hypothetical protein
MNGFRARQRPNLVSARFAPRTGAGRVISTSATFFSDKHPQIGELSYRRIEVWPNARSAPEKRIFKRFLAIFRPFPVSG